MMNEIELSHKVLARLPHGAIDPWRKPLARFLKIEAGAGLLLLLAAVLALVLSNSPWSHPFLSLWETRVGLHWGALDYVRPIKEWINDGLMTLFFFLVALELKREFVLGELSSPRLAALSIAAAVGGMLFPAGLYLLLQWGGPGADGWGTVMATDTAFVIGGLALLGSRVPHSLRVFMISLAIVDDIGAILVVAFGYSGQITWEALATAVVALLFVRVLAVLGVRSVPIYFLLGAFIWMAVDRSGIHPTVTGVILGLMTPARRWVSDERLYALLDQVIAHPAAAEGSGKTRDRETLHVAEIAARETLSPLERLEMALHPWVGLVIMPLFAIANAGAPLAFAHLHYSITVAVVLAFVIGKPLGIITFSWLAVRGHLAVRPPDLSWRALSGGGLLAGIGFTMALFIANLAFDPELGDSAKVGIFLSSIVSALAGLLVLRSLPQPKRSGLSI